VRCGGFTGTFQKPRKSHVSARPKKSPLKREAHAQCFYTCLAKVTQSVYHHHHHYVYLYTSMYQLGSPQIYVHEI